MSHTHTIQRKESVDNHEEEHKRKIQEKHVEISVKASESNTQSLQSKSSSESPSDLKKSTARVDILSFTEPETSPNPHNKNSANNSNENHNHDAVNNSGNFTTVVEDIRKRRIEAALAKKKQDEEERERFVKESAEKKAAERAEIIKQAKRLILYRKPMCRRINRALLLSECYRELDASLKFQETVKNMDKKEEMMYVKLIEEDVAKYEEEQKEETEKHIEKQRKYANELKEQMEENDRTTKQKEYEEFEAAKQYQMNINKYLQDLKEHEEQELLRKKQRMKQFFNDAIENKRRYDLKFKQEEEFEDRAIEAYQSAKARIKKMHKEVQLNKRQDIARQADVIARKYQEFVRTKEDLEEKILKKAVEEQEAEYQEKEKVQKEREARMRMELQDLQKKTTAVKLKELEEVKDLKAWEMMQRFERAKYNMEVELKEKDQQRRMRIEYGNVLKKHINEKEAERKQNKLLEEKAADVTGIIEKENQKILDYAEEVINESRDVRPLYPILKAVEKCKKEMGLVPLRKREETVTVIESKKKQRRPHTCTKFVPEHEICYLK